MAFLFILLIISFFMYFIWWFSSSHLLFGYIIALFFFCHLLWAFTSKINLDTVRVMPPIMEPIYLGMKRVPYIESFVCLFVYCIESVPFEVVHLCFWCLNPCLRFWFAFSSYNN